MQVPLKTVMGDSHEVAAPPGPRLTLRDPDLYHRLMKECSAEERAISGPSTAAPYAAPPFVTEYLKQNDVRPLKKVRHAQCNYCLKVKAFQRCIISSFLGHANCQGYLIITKDCLTLKKLRKARKKAVTSGCVPWQIHATSLAAYAFGLAGLAPLGA